MLGKRNEKIRKSKGYTFVSNPISNSSLHPKNKKAPAGPTLSSKEELHAASEYLKQENSLLKRNIGLLEKRISRIEQSTIWKIKKGYDKVRYVFRNSTPSTSGGGLLRYIKFFLSKHFLRVFRKFFKTVFKNLYLLLEDKPVRIVYLDNTSIAHLPLHQDPYQAWIEKNMPRPSDLDDHRRNIEFFSYKPFFSILVPVYNPQVTYFRAMLDSLLAQVYPHFEVCLADDASTNKEIQKIIKEYAAKDPRIQYILRKENGHISACSNSALSIATGEFAVLVDHDDLITEDALYQVARTLNEEANTDFLYSDEDKINDSNQFHEAHFKPDWSPDNFLSRNYICHLAVLRTAILREVGGFREGFEGSQDYDLFLRFFEKTNKIVHIPKVLYHWRVHRASTAMNQEAKPYAFIAGQKALAEALVRRNEPGRVLHGASPGTYVVRYQRTENAKISILIPSKNKANVLSACLHSIFEKSSYKNFEVIVIDNGSSEADVFRLYATMDEKYPEQFNYYLHDIPFNFSSLINHGRSKATGDFLLLLNNDTEVITEDWMEAMIEFAQRTTTGVVGCKLLYPNDTIQHAGVVIGMGGAAGHSFVQEQRNAASYFNYINSISNYSALTAACIMIKATVFDEANGFEENFSVEYNDIDFCLRVKELGYHNVYLPHVELYHHESLSRGTIFASKRSTLLHEKEKGLFVEKWNAYIHHDPCYSKHLSLEASDFRIRM